MLTARLAAFFLALATTQAALILDSQLRSVNDNGAIQSSTDSGILTFGSLPPVGQVYSASGVSTSGFSGSFVALVSPVFPGGFFAEAKFDATFILTQTQSFAISAMAENGPHGGLARFDLKGEDGTWINVGVLGGPSNINSFNETVLLPAQRYTISAVVESRSSTPGDDGFIRVNNGQLGFSIVPITAAPEPSTLLPLGLAVLSLGLKRRSSAGTLCARPVQRQ